MTTSTRGIGVHWVYRCFDHDGRLIYVGCTTNLPNRLEQHRTASWWSPTVAKVTSRVYPDGPSGRAAERQAIRDEVPRWNKSGKWAGRSNWAREDWCDWITVLLRDPGASTSLANSIRDYRSLFGEDIPPKLRERVSEYEAAEEARRLKHQEALEEQQKAWRDRETEELRDLNEHLTRLLERQERLARALGIDYDDPELLDAETAIDEALAKLEKEQTK